MDIKKWIKEELEKGEDIEVVKGAVEILGFDKKLVNQVLQELKKEKPLVVKKDDDEKQKKQQDKQEVKEEHKIPREETKELQKQDTLEKKEMPKQEEKHYLKEEPVEVLEFHVPRELIKEHEKHTKEIKKYITYLLIFIGVSLIMLGAYLFYYIRR